MNADPPIRCKRELMQRKRPGKHGEYDTWSFGKDDQAGGADEAADINSRE